MGAHASLNLGKVLHHAVKIKGVLTICLGHYAGTTTDTPAPTRRGTAHILSVSSAPYYYHAGIVALHPPHRYEQEPKICLFIAEGFAWNVSGRVLTTLHVSRDGLQPGQAPADSAQGSTLQ